MALVERVFTDMEPLSDIEQNYDIDGPLALVRDGRWLAHTVLSDTLSPVKPSEITYEWIQATNRQAEKGNANIRDARSGTELALIEPTNNARLEVIKRFGWTQPGGLFAEVAAQDTLAPQDLPKSAHLFQVLRILFACTGARIMEPLANDKRNNPDRPPALAYKSPTHLRIQLGMLLEAEIPPDDIGHILIGFPDLFSQRILGHQADKVLVFRARVFLDTGGKTSSGSPRRPSGRTIARRTAVNTSLPDSPDRVSLDELTTEPIPEVTASSERRPAEGKQARPAKAKDSDRQPSAPMAEPVPIVPETSEMGKPRIATIPEVEEKVSIDMTERVAERIDPLAEAREAFYASDEDRQALIRNVLDYFHTPDLDKLLIACPGILHCDTEILSSYMTAADTWDELSDVELRKRLKALLPVSGRELSSVEGKNV